MGTLASQKGCSISCPWRLQTGPPFGPYSGAVYSWGPAHEGFLSAHPGASAGDRG